MKAKTCVKCLGNDQPIPTCRNKKEKKNGTVLHPLDRPSGLSHLPPCPVFGSLIGVVNSQPPRNEGPAPQSGAGILMGALCVTKRPAGPCLRCCWWLVVFMTVAACGGSGGLQLPFLLGLFRLLPRVHPLSLHSLRWRRSAAWPHHALLAFSLLALIWNLVQKYLSSFTRHCHISSMCGLQKPKFYLSRLSWVSRVHSQGDFQCPKICVTLFTKKNLP